MFDIPIYFCNERQDIQWGGDYFLVPKYSQNDLKGSKRGAAAL